ncbi:unnamed protein product [Gadus morhua 'NCC']
MGEVTLFHRHHVALGRMIRCRGWTGGAPGGRAWPLHVCGAPKPVFYRGPGPLCQVLPRRAGHEEPSLAPHCCETH